MLRILYKLKDGSEKNFTLWKVLAKRKYSLFISDSNLQSFVLSLLLMIVIIYNFKFMLTRVTLKDMKAFLPRVNCKIATNRLRELFQEVDTKSRNELGFDDFVALYHKLMLDQNVSVLSLYIEILSSIITRLTLLKVMNVVVESCRLE